MPHHHDATGPRAIVFRLSRLVRRLAEQRSQPGRPAAAASAPWPEGLARTPLTTVEATIRPEARPGYRRLVWGEGEDHIVRHDLGTAPGERVDIAQRRSVLYFAHHTDSHLCDAQSPSRLEPGERFAWFNPGADGGHRPQEACTAQVFDQMVRATNAVKISPLTGAEMALCVLTGDNTDNRTISETSWFLDVLAGRPVEPNTGLTGRYEGIQRSGAQWTFQADDPGHGTYGKAGYPALPGFLDAAVQLFQPEGLAVPWLAVIGNHDSVFLGTFGPLPLLRFDRYAELLVGAARKPIGVVGMLAALAHATFVGVDPKRWDGGVFGTQSVTADPDRRRPLDMREYIAALLADGADPDAPNAGPGPAGHGFTEENERDAIGWWSRPEGEQVQLIGLDTCNHTRGSEGVLADAQYRWLEAELQGHHSRWFGADGEERAGDGTDRLCIVFSHHNSWTMTNEGPDTHFAGPRHQGEDLIALLHRFPNVVLWVNGHSHEHRILPHPAPQAGAAGFWEVNTASCIDFGQQARTIELLDNDDGTLSLVTTVLDHAAPPSVEVPADATWTPTTLASMSRELAANDDFWFDPMSLLGRPEDRNTELVVPSPFPLS